MSIKKTLIITALSAIMLGGAAQAFAKTVVLHAPNYQNKSYRIWVNGKQKGTCGGYYAGNGWQKTKANANPGDRVMIVFYTSCFNGKSLSIHTGKVPNDKLKYFWVRA